MNLFENLQTMQESSALLERDNLTVSEYNKLKVALNKNNAMRANFILHPGRVEVEGYKMRIRVYGAFRSFEKTKIAYHAAYSDSDSFTNDQITRDGVGVVLYNIYINLIDNSIKFGDVVHSYELDRYLSRYEDLLLDNGSIKSDELDLQNLKSTIIEVANASKIDIEQALLSKNFIYNLTGTRKTKQSSSPEYNLNLESTTLKEDFDPSMPNWLMRAIKLNNSNKSFSHRDLNYTMPFDTMKWEVEPFPEKGKLDTIGNNEYIALLIDASGDEHKGDYVVYFPAAYIGNYETITVNNRNRQISSMSLRALAPYVKEFAHTVGNEKSVNDVRQKRQNRAIAQDGSIDRTIDQDDYWSRDIRDKSGYIVDPNKYKRLLAQNKQGEYSDRLDDLFLVLTDVRTKIKDYMSNDETIPSPGKKDYSRDSKFNRGTRAYREYSEAINNYSDALEILEKIRNAEKDRWGESFEIFDDYVKQSEKHTVNCLNILENK